MRSKSVLMLGMGFFGQHMAEKLIQMGHDVLAIEQDATRANQVAEIIPNIQIGDATDKQLIAGLGVRNFDLCVVTIGQSFQHSLMATTLLKDSGAKFVVSRAIDSVHEQFLLRNGADAVVYPERLAGERAAIRYSMDTIFDYIQLSDDYSIVEAPVPEGWKGKSIQDLGIRRKQQINVLAVKWGKQVTPVTDPSYQFSGDETVIMMGSEKNLKKVLHF